MDTVAEARVDNIPVTRNTEVKVSEIPVVQLEEKKEENVEAKKRGPKKRNGRHINVYVSMKTYESLSNIKVEDGSSISTIVNNMILQCLKQLKEESSK